VAELLAFLQEEFAGALLVVAKGVVDGESNLIGNEGRGSGLRRENRCFGGGRRSRGCRDGGRLL